MKIYDYKNYDDYIQHQKKWNEKKFGKMVYVKKDTIQKIANDFGRGALAVLCHGTRDGSEQRFFKEHYPNAQVIGSEIGPSAKESEMTVEHDFNKVMESWVGKFDIVYSNSFDHTITPVETLKVWRDQLSSVGILYLEYAESRSSVSESDPLGATNEEVRGFIRDAGMKIIREIDKNIKHGGRIFVCKRSGA